LVEVEEEVEAVVLVVMGLRELVAMEGVAAVVF
jgi:hypothetical protein